MTAERIKAYQDLSERLAAYTDDELVDLLQGHGGQEGWGISRTVVIDGHQVFAKSLPLTDRELANPASTRNLFDLPVVYNYGVGSAGFGAAREVATNEKTTGWVLDGLFEQFPLTYHKRVLPLPSQTRQGDPARLDRYVASWDGDTAIRDFTVAREASTQCITLFCEHIPYTLMEWLPQNQSAIESVIDQALLVTEFLRSHDVAHLDLNPTNVLVDEDGRLFFADFGLFLDGDFDLVAEEREFLANHRFFDIGEFIASLTWPHPGQPVSFAAAYLSGVEPFSKLAAEMFTVFTRLAEGPKSLGYYDDNKMERLLHTAMLRRQS